HPRHAFPARRSSDLDHAGLKFDAELPGRGVGVCAAADPAINEHCHAASLGLDTITASTESAANVYDHSLPHLSVPVVVCALPSRSEEHTSELQSREN